MAINLLHYIKVGKIMMETAFAEKIIYYFTSV